LRASAVESQAPTLLGARVRALYRYFAAGEPYAVLLEGMDPRFGTVGDNPAVNRWSLIGFRPRQIIRLRHHMLQVNGNEQPITDADDLFRRLRGILAACRTVPGAGIPFHGGLVGYFGYDFARWCDPALFSQTSRLEETFPSLLLCEFEDWLAVDRLDGTLQVLSPDWKREAAYRKIWESLPGSYKSAKPWIEPDPAYLAGFEASLSPRDFALAVARIREAIAEGEIYQANLSLRLAKTLKLDPSELYEALSARNPSPFSAMMQWPGGMILSNSPERLVKFSGDRVEARPIAGTRGRGASAEEDTRIGDTLRKNDKERAEHLMLVDLLRNDLGRVCAPGTVKVDELLSLERYSHVTHLVSNVSGERAWGADAWDVLKAVFPGGTITGCPKIRCMEILQALEPVARGAYTGSLGYVDALNGAMDLNILIRSLFLEETVTPFVYNSAVHVGAGIVADSVAPHEYRECLRKAAAILGVLYAHEQDNPSHER
jgi:para-aminobenzoate synthetase component I